MRKKMLELAHKTATTAQQAGANDARVFVTRSRQVQVEWRDGKLDRIRESTNQGLSITLYVDGRYSSNATSDLRPEALERYIREAVAATRYLAVDKHRQLPPPERYQDMIATDLKLRDEAVTQVTAEQRLAWARNLEEAVRAAPGNDKLISVTTSASDVDSMTIGVATNGLEAEEQGSVFVQYADASVKDEGDRKPSDYGYGQSRFLKDLPATSLMAQTALRRALDQCGTKALKTGKYTVIIENRVGGSMIRHLLSPLSGSAIQQKRSFLEGKIGQQITTDKLTVVDNPHLPKGLGSSAWDSEGMATIVRPILKQGVLQLYYMDTYNASKLNLVPTTSGASNLEWSLGKRSQEDILKEVKEGILVTSFLGGNSNSTTGDFSLGIKGFYIKDGKRIHPVSEMNMAGNHLEFWMQLAEIGNDPFPYSSTQTPTLRFEGVDCSGK
jgi:PmbA protein